LLLAGVLTVAPAPVTSSQAAAAPAAAGELVEQGNRVFEDASSEIANIDQRLHALQDFLRKAKSSVAAS
jgi:coiled-coil domain-containing protein 61